MLCSPLDLPLARLPGMADDMPWPERSCPVELPTSRLPGMSTFFALDGQWSSFPGAESAIPAEGGVVILANRRWLFALSPEVHQRVVRRLGRRVSPLAPVEPILCHSMPPRKLALGAFRHPLTGCYCEPTGLPSAWVEAWRSG